MNYRWSVDGDGYFLADTNLEVEHAEGDWRLIAYVRCVVIDKSQFVCRFMSMADDAFPDGARFKTLRGAKKFCERHLPVMWIKYCINYQANE